MKTRVIEVLASLQRAGAERMAVSLACGLDASKFEVEVVSLYDALPQGFEGTLEQHNIRTSHLGKRRGLDLRMINRLRQVFRLSQPAIIHTHSYVLRYTVPAALTALRGTGYTMAHTVHNIATREVDPLGRTIHRWAFRRGVVPVAVGTEVARSFHDVYGFQPAATIPNGIDLGEFVLPSGGQTARHQWRCEEGFAIEDGLVVSVARLEPQKNPLGLIEAFALALRDQPRWHLLLVGEGGLQPAARRRAVECDIGNRVHFLGVRRDIPQLLAACDIFALASHWEGNPMSIMEAMAAGLPVVATRVGSIPDLVEHGQTGFLPRSGDVREFAEALAALAIDSDRRHHFAVNARKQAARFSVTAMISAYENLFERLRAEGPR